MAFRISSQSGKKTYNLKELVVDTFNDITTINVNNLAIGSTAFIIDTSEHYMLNSKRKWIKIICGGSSGMANPNDYEIIYDGGIITITPPGTEEEEEDVIYDGGGVIK